MLDGLGMAETTPGPLILVVQFVGFLAAFRDPGGLDPWLAARAGVGARHLGHLRAVLPLDLPRRALDRAAARQPRARRRAGRDHRRGGRRDPEPRALVRAARGLPRGRPPFRGFGLDLDLPVPASVDWAALALVVAALVATFRFRLGMLPLLAGAAPLGCCGASGRVGLTARAGRRMP